MAGLISAVHERGCPIKFRVNGISMFPFIRDNDLITIVPTVSNKVSTGDVIAHMERETAALLVHRVIRRQKEIFYIKGDNLGLPDAPVSGKDILGKIAAIDRNGRPVRFSLGPEKKIIAALSRIGLLKPLMDVLRILKNSIG